MTRKKTFDPNQLRWKKGTPKGGQWKSTEDLIAEKAIMASGIGSVNMGRMKNEGYKIHKKDYRSGMYESEKVTLDNGLKAIMKPNPQPNRFGRDNSKREALTYELDEALGLGVVPYTYFDEAEDASFQLWIDGATVGAEVGSSDPPIDINPEDVSKVFLLDMLLNNHDRHEYNWVVSPEIVLDDQTGKERLMHRLWAIDNGCAIWDGRDMEAYDFDYARDNTMDIIYSSPVLRRAYGRHLLDPRKGKGAMPLAEEYKDILQDLIDDGYFYSGNFGDVLTDYQQNMIVSHAESILYDWGEYFYDPSKGQTP